MSFDLDEFYDESEQDAAPKRRRPPPKAPVEKQSYESSVDVQRWLEEQSLEDGLTKGRFEPELLAGRRDKHWLLSSLQFFYEQDLITDVVSEVSSGKEATVFCCQAHPSTGERYLAAKIYRPRMFRNLKNDAVYREGRPMLDSEGRTIRDRRGRRAASKHNERGRALQVAAWIQYEYQTQQRVYAAGADIPRPVAQVGNAVLMEFVGIDADPAPLLQHAELEPDEARPMFERLMHNITALLACNCIHGDLSAYNILYLPGRATIIDFAQAVDPRHSDDAYTLLERDIDRVCRFFAPYGVEAAATSLAVDLWMRYLHGGLAPALAPRVNGFERW